VVTDQASVFVQAEPTGMNKFDGAELVVLWLVTCAPLKLETEMLSTEKGLGNKIWALLLLLSVTVIAATQIVVVAAASAVPRLLRVLFRGTVEPDRVEVSIVPYLYGIPVSERHLLVLA
jgi:hypothetical protein